MDKRNEKSNSILDEILSIMEQNGILFEGEDDKDNIFEMDSLTFMSIVVDLEVYFKMSISEAVLVKTFVKYSDFIEEIYSTICAHIESDMRIEE